MVHDVAQEGWRCLAVGDVGLGEVVGGVVIDDRGGLLARCQEGVGSLRCALCCPLREALGDLGPAGTVEDLLCARLPCCCVAVAGDAGVQGVGLVVPELLHQGLGALGVEVAERQRDLCGHRGRRIPGSGVFM